jgi:hypothetical protein
MFEYMKFKSLDVVKIGLTIKSKFLPRKFCIKMLFGNHYFSPLKKKREGSGSGSVLVTNGS